MNKYIFDFKNNALNKENGFKVFYTNADSLLNKRSEMELLVAEIKPNIIAVTEVIAKNQQSFEPSEYTLKGYTMFVNKNPKLGTIIYMKDELNAVENSTLSNSNFEEAIFCNFVANNGERVLVGCVYRSPSSGDENFENLTKLLKDEELTKFDKICIMGDFNLPFINWEGSNTNTRAVTFVECLRDSFLEQMVKLPTRRRSNNRPTLDDLILVNDEKLISDITHFNPLGKSDHDLLIFNLYVESNNKKDNVTVKFDLFRGDYDQMRSDLKLISWDEMINLDVEHQWNFLKDKIKSCMNKNIPKIDKSNKSKKKPKWFNGQVKKSVRKKYLLYMRYLRSDASRDYHKYIEQRNKCNRDIKRAKREYERKISHECKENPKKFWQYVQEKTKCVSGISPLDKGDGNLAFDSKEKADILNRFFSSVFTHENVDNVPDLEPGSRSDHTFLSDVVITEEAVRKKLQQLNPSKAQGPDGIPPKVLKEVSTEIAKPITLLFNTSISQGIVPNDWNTAEVVAIFKKGTRSDPGNYRPVSLTCVLCKMLESFIRDAIVSHMTDLNLYSPCQHGFRRNRSCVTNLLEVMETITDHLDDGSPVDMLYLDFRKAFDAVPHQRLLTKLKSYGVTDNVFNWVKDFLSNRTQCVRVDNAYSDRADVLSGIPQGSILGPVLFTIFINDIADVVSSGCRIFADDTKVYNKCCNSDVIQNDILNLQEWTNTWNLYFNVAKCKVLHIGQNNPNKEYTMNNNNGSAIIDSCENEKDLGVTFDCKLTFDAHVQNVIKKANRILGIIRRTFTFMDVDTFLRLYKTMVRPHLEYANAVWAPHLKRLSQDIERVQRRATKLLPVCKNMSYLERLEFLNLFSLKYRRFRGDCIQTFKIINKIDDLNFNDFYSNNIGITRNADFKLNVLRCNKDVKKYSFSHRSTKYWNSLSILTKRAKTVDAFKRLLDIDDKELCGCFDHD